MTVFVIAPVVWFSLCSVRRHIDNLPISENTNMKPSPQPRSTVRKTKLPKPPAGKVGIFWVFHGRILAATFALADGEAYGDAVNGLTDHVHHWPKLQEANPALRGLEYQDVPRGRVLFMKPEARFHVYLDKALTARKIQRSILQEFQLPAVGTRFLTDPHYTTDPEELDRLFAPE